MSAHDIDQLHMIYEGPRPARPNPILRPDDDEDGAEAFLETLEPGPARPWITTVVAAAAAAILGVGAGVWLTVHLRSGAANPPPAASSQPVSAPNLAKATPPATITILPKAAPPLVAHAGPGSARQAEALPSPKRHPAIVKANIETKSRASAKHVEKAKATGKTSPRSANPCGPGLSRAEAIICADPSIATEDQEMRRAYQRALASGASVKALESDQQTWLIASEEAARRSPADLAAAYKQRISDLNALATEAPH